jgi:hypothetical protein
MNSSIYNGIFPPFKQGSKHASKGGDPWDNPFKDMGSANHHSWSSGFWSYVKGKPRRDNAAAQRDFVGADGCDNSKQEKS